MKIIYVNCGVKNIDTDFGNQGSSWHLSIIVIYDS